MHLNVEKLLPKDIIIKLVEDLIELPALTAEVLNNR